MITRLFILSFALLFSVTTYAQTSREVYLKGVEQAQAGNLEKAIELFTKVIEIDSGYAYAWYNRGIAKSFLNLYEDALLDFEKTIKYAPDYPKGYLNRGIAKKHLTDYQGAIEDYSHVISLDTENANAYYNRAIVYQMLDRKDEACSDYSQALKFGLKRAEQKVERCNSTNTFETHNILRLTRTAKNEKYGFTSSKPVLVGSGVDGGPANQRAYLELLRDAQGKPVKYERVGTKAYKSNNGFIKGMAMLDKYQIEYKDENGDKQTRIVYISFYDYKEPKILYGFGTVKRP